MTTRASRGALPRSATTNRRTLAYRAGKPWSSTRSCQMATALRPRVSASMMISRYGSQALALGVRPGGGGPTGSVDTTALVIAGFAPRSVDTPSEMAGFAFDSLPSRGQRRRFGRRRGGRIRDSHPDLRHSFVSRSGRQRESHHDRWFHRTVKRRLALRGGRSRLDGDREKGLIVGDRVELDIR